MKPHLSPTAKALLLIGIAAAGSVYYGGYWFLLLLMTALWTSHAFPYSSWFLLPLPFLPFLVAALLSTKGIFLLGGRQPRQHRWQYHLCWVGLLLAQVVISFPLYRLFN